MELRRVEKLVAITTGKEAWQPCRMSDLVVRDLFRMFEPDDNEPVEKKAVFQVQHPPFLNDLGIWTVQCEAVGFWDKPDIAMRFLTFETEEGR